METENRFSSKNFHTIDLKMQGVIKPSEFDPFASRNVKNPTTNFDTFAHLLKAVFGTGILAMPFAFRKSGLLLGGFGAIFIGLISTHCAYILVKSAHILYYKAEKTTMSLPDVAEEALSSGPKPLRKYSKLGRYSVQIILFIAYFGTCSVFAVIAAQNYRSVINYYFNPGVDEKIISAGFGLRWMILCLLIPLIILSWFPDLKYLAPVSMIANFFMASSVVIIFYWIYTNDSFDLDKLKYYPSSFEEFKTDFPKFFSITIFAMESIGVIMPIENKMKTPRKFIGTFGVLNLGMTTITIMYIIIGILGCMNDPNSNKEMIVLEIPRELTISTVVRILVGTSVMCTCRLLFSVCLEIAESWMENFNVKKSIKSTSFIFRTVLMTACVLLAVALPAIGPFMSLIGALFFSIQGFIIPVILETITIWDFGFGFCKWIAIKNIIIVIVSIFAIVYGTADALVEIKNIEWQ